MAFARGNKLGAHRKNNNGGRPRKLLRTVREVVGDESLEKLLQKTFVDAFQKDGTSRAWVLSQLPKINTEKLPPGLPRLDSFENYMLALDEIGEHARQGKLTIAAAESASALIERLALARASILAKSAPLLDQTVAAQIVEEREARKRPPVVDVGRINAPRSKGETH